MRTQAWPVVLVVAVAGAALLPGCGGGRQKELPKTVTAGTEKAAPAAEKAPDKSDPAAAAVVEKALKAATDGHPERIEKAKVNRLAMKGTVVRPAGPLPTLRRVEAVWPDNLALTDEFNDGLPTKVMIRFRRPALWTGNVREGTTTAVDLGDPKGREAYVVGDTVGRHWMPLLIPLTDPKTVVFGLRQETVAGQTADVVKAAVPGATPIYTLWFDVKTSLLGRIDFALLEPGATTPTQESFGFPSHRAFGGLMLPAFVKYGHNALPVEDWSVDSWEFPDRIDDAAFTAPR